MRGARAHSLSDIYSHISQAVGCGEPKSSTWRTSRWHPNSNAHWWDPVLIYTLEDFIVVIYIWYMMQHRLNSGRSLLELTWKDTWRSYNVSIILSWWLEGEPPSIGYCLFISYFLYWPQRNSVFRFLSACENWNLCDFFPCVGRPVKQKEKSSSLPPWTFLLHHLKYERLRQCLSYPPIINHLSPNIFGWYNKKIY